MLATGDTSQQRGCRGAGSLGWREPPRTHSGDGSAGNPSESRTAAETSEAKTAEVPLMSMFSVIISYKGSSGQKVRRKEHSGLPLNPTTDASKRGGGEWDDLGDWD